MHKICTSQAEIENLLGCKYRQPNKEPVCFLLVSGKPLNESIAWRGPIVMNAEGELWVAFEECHGGRFIKN